MSPDASKSSSADAPHGRAIRAPRRAALGLLSVLAIAPLTGCLDSDSFLDPSIVGRWENTPTVVPILERIDVIERDTGEFVDVTPVLPEDLIPEPTEYRVAPGDLIEIEILDFVAVGVVSPYVRTVTSRGFINIPQLGDIDVQGLTRQEVEVAITRAIIDAQLIDDPLVTVQVPGQRQATFSIFGAVPQVGRYAIPSPDYSLLEAITDAGGVNPAIPKIFIIRQISLDDPRSPARAPAQDQGQPASEDQGQDLLDLIDELTDPDDDGAAPSPALFGANVSMSLQEGDDQGQPENAPPPIDLIDLEPAEPVQPAGQPANPQTLDEIQQPGRWVFIGGEWVQVISTGSRPQGLPEGEDPLEASDGPLVTQRIIEVPTEPLLQGVARYNVVVRPGDVVSVPAPAAGLVYVGGPGIARPGVYNIPATGTLTLQRLVFSAGGFSAIAIPNRVDLTRMVGDSRQATIRVNMRAIFAGTHPDIVVKPDDLVNFGTNFWATPLAIIRGGFRASYGFGFLLDRNFGNDVFGAPPTNQVGQ